MQSKNSGAIPLGRVAGVDLYLHWSWFLVAAIEISTRRSMYSTWIWNVLEYLALFAIVLMHEFGHAMACRQVGGVADRIMLWPLGGVAYVKPPQRPGATLWSIAAGPLVNVGLIPILLIATMLTRSMGWRQSHHDVYLLLRQIFYIDIVLLVFNMLPSYPLDGGQILRSLLWFVMGRARSLMVTTALGFVGVLGIAALAVWWRSPWTAAVAVFMGVSCWNGWNTARVMLRIEKAPRRAGFSCPNCGMAPQICKHWQCDQCKEKFDPFETSGVCPGCWIVHLKTACLDCHETTAMRDWVGVSFAEHGMVSSSFEAK